MQTNFLLRWELNKASYREHKSHRRIYCYVKRRQKQIVRYSLNAYNDATFLSINWIFVIEVYQQGRIISKNTLDAAKKLY